MATIARFLSARSADLGLAVGQEDRGWSLLPEVENAASLTGSVVGLVFTPVQVERLFPKHLGLKSGDDGLEHHFDGVFKKLQVAVRAKALSDVDKHAEEFIARIPEMMPQIDEDLASTAFDFYKYLAKDVSSRQREAFVAQFCDDQIRAHFKTARQRVDVLKGQALALAAQGMLWGYHDDPIAQIRAEIAFARDAIQQLGTGSEKMDLADTRLPPRVEAMPVFLPDFIFQIDRCAWPNQGETDPTETGGVPHSGSGGAHAAVAIPDAAASTTSKSTPRRGDKPFTDDLPSTDLDDYFELPGDGVDPTCGCDCEEPECAPTEECCGDINYYIADLLELREETVEYVPDGLAYIENVAPGETRVREHMFGKTIDVYSEDETTTRRLEERDQIVTDRSQLRKEMKKQMSARLDVEATITGKVYTVNTNASVSRDVAHREAREKFREMVTQAKESIETETRSLRTRRVTTETKETNTHTLQGGNDGVVAKFFHVAERKRGQVFSHGLHLMLDILIPSPAQRYVELQRRKAEKSFKLEKPRRPSVAPDDLKPGWHDAYVKVYELVDAPRPPDQPTENKSTIKEGNLGNTLSIAVPDGYEATTMTMLSSKALRTRLNEILGNEGSISFQFGGGIVTGWVGSGTTNIQTSSVSATGTTDAFISGYRVMEEASIKVKITFSPIPVDIRPWQTELHTLIMEGYQQKLQTYEDALAEHNMRFKEAEKQMHPFTAEEHMRTQVKQSAIWMLCDKFGDEGAFNLRAEDGCGYPEINRRTATDVTKRWHFFDRVCDWGQMEIMFYDYYRNPVCKWVDTFDPDEPNFLFKTFLRAGYCRVQIPVTIAMEYDMLTYLKTGKTWGGNGEPPQDATDLRYGAVVRELKHSYGCYQNDRHGVITAQTTTDAGGNLITANRVTLASEGTDDALWPYHENGALIPDADRDLDLGREIFINGVAYRLVAIDTPTGSPATGYEWTLTLDRPLESPPHVTEGDTSSDLRQYRHAIGAKFIGDAFYFTIPVDAVWMGDMFQLDASSGIRVANMCLPKYPIECV
ncbi:hypothetical protein [Planktotalea sp.]|uniref:hypothetical protein n=1 Tax=Planktotalea sp. TaxID=2029877 RepID=UPI003D6B30EC